MIQRDRMSWICRQRVYSLRILSLGFNLLHYFLLEIGIAQVSSIIDNLVLLKFRLQLAFPFRHICMTATPDYRQGVIWYIICTGKLARKQTGTNVNWKNWNCFKWNWNKRKRTGATTQQIKNNKKVTGYGRERHLGSKKTEKEGNNEKQNETKTEMKNPIQGKLITVQNLWSESRDCQMSMEDRIWGNAVVL